MGSEALQMEKLGRELMKRIVDSWVKNRALYSLHHCESSQTLGPYYPDLGLGLASSGFRPVRNCFSSANRNGPRDGRQARGCSGPGRCYREVVGAMEYHRGGSAIGAPRVYRKAVRPGGVAPVRQSATGAATGLPPAVVYRWSPDGLHSLASRGQLERFRRNCLFLQHLLFFYGPPNECSRTG